MRKVSVCFSIAKSRAALARGSGAVPWLSAGSVETSTFDTQKRTLRYQLFINAPYDRLVTSNVRF